MKKVIIEVNDNREEFNFSELEIADFFTRIDKGELIKAFNNNNDFVKVYPFQIDRIIVYGDGEIEFDSGVNETEANDNFEEEFNENISGLFEVIEALENEYPFLKINVDLKIKDEC